MEQMFERALEIADSHLEQALRQNAELAPYISVAMIEAAVNQAIEITSPEDVVAMLHDLAGQIEADLEDEDDGEDDGE
jgi:hypothetical protein